MKNIIISNNISIKGEEINATSKTLEGFKPIINASIIEKLKENSNIIVKEFTSEFGLLENLNENILNELKKDENQIAIIAEMGLNGLKQKNNNLIVLKPSYGRCSRYGIFGYSSSMDNILIFGKNIDEIGNTLELIAGRDDKDLTSINEEFKYSKECKCGGKCDKNCNCGCSEDDIVKFSLFEELELDKKLIDISNTIVKIISSAEATTNLAGIDGIRYGKREEGKSYDEIIINSRSNFTYETKRNLLFGSYVLRKDNLQNIYYKSMKIRKKIKEMIDDVFYEADYIVFRKDKSKIDEEKIISIAILGGFPVLKIEKENLIIISKLKNEKGLLNFGKDIIEDADILDESILVDEIEEEENV